MQGEKQVCEGKVGSGCLSSGGRGAMCPGGEGGSEIRWDAVITSNAVGVKRGISDGEGVNCKLNNTPL